MLKQEEKEKAIALRKDGLSYREILQQVSVAKSTLSLWLRSVGLSRKQKQRLTRKKILAALRGAETRRHDRIVLTKRIHKLAQKDIGSISQRELWLMGVMLHWAEGSKEKEDRPGLGVRFSNSDPWMIKLFLKWLIEVVDVKREDVGFGIFVHESHKRRIGDIIRFWSSVSEFPQSRFTHVYFKKNKIKTSRKNTGDTYYGLLRVGVKASSSLNRKIVGWIKGINKYYWGVV